MSLKGSPIERTISDQSPSMTVISAVAEATGTDPLEIEPLYDTIDPDALDDLFEVNPMAPFSFDGRVSFTMEGCDVVVSGDRKVVVTPARGNEDDDRTNSTERDIR